MNYSNLNILVIREPCLDEFQFFLTIKTSFESARTLQNFFGLLFFIITCQDIPFTKIYNAFIR
jgi:hypothetical protein